MPGNDVIHPICDRWGRLRNFDFCATTEPTRTWPYMLWVNPDEQTLRIRNAADDDWIAVGGGNGGGGAPTNASYIVLGFDGTLTKERRLVAGDGLQATDAGPNGDYTLAVKVADFAGTGLENDGSNNLRIAAAAAGDGLTGGGGSALAVSVTAIAGTGLENDGSNNLRIAAAAAGDGLTGGGGSALAVDSTVVRTSGAQSIAGLKSFTDGIALGTTPAQSGMIRLPQSEWIVARNATDTDDVNMWRVVGAGIEAGASIDMGNKSIQGIYAIYQNSHTVWQIDNNGNALFYGNLTLSGPSRALKGSGSNWPDLGTTTLAERIGNIYMIGEVYAAKDEAGLFKRVHNFLTDPQEDFDGADFEWLTGGWAASGAVFSGTPDGLDFSVIPESCVLLTDSVQNDYFYRYRSISNPSGSSWKVYMRIASIWGSDVAIRIDAGSNANENDFGELIIGHTEGNATMDIKRRYQENGGGITSSTLLSSIPCGPITIRITAGAPNAIYCYYGYGDAPYNRLTFLSSNIGDLDSWGSVASRIGISYKRTSAAASNRAVCIDFFHTTGLTPT